ncbi:MAG TPA: GNAT family N-acetyltransferase [Candidatus Limnocylindria bacterium]
MTTALAAVSARAYHDDLDWQRLHDLLVRIHGLTGRWRCWTPDRIDGFLRGCIYDESTNGSHGWRDRIRLWEAPSGQLIGAVHHEGREEAWLELDPAWPQLAPELLDWAEQAHAARHAETEPAPVLQAYAVADDAERQALLAGRGYVDRGPTEVLHGRSLADPGPVVALPDGYRIRRIDLAEPGDRRQLVDITRLTFTHATYDERAIDLEPRMLTEHEYLAAIAPNGSFAAWCGVWLSPDIGVGQFEPVGTHPDHRRRGLASAVMARGLDLMRRHGLDKAYVGTGVTNASNYLYASLGFSVAELYHQWEWRPR